MAPVRIDSSRRSASIDGLLEGARLAGALAGNACGASVLPFTMGREGLTVQRP